MKKIRVLIIDDSALMRQLLTGLLEDAPEIEVIATAADPYIARNKIKALDPDVLTLDVEMPRMDGLTFLEKLMRGHPMPVVMVSSLTEKGCQTTLRALELGAVDFFTKPKFDMENGMTEQAAELIEKIKTASQAQIRQPATDTKMLTPLTYPTAMLKTTDMILAIGASTGGTEAIKDLLEVMPANTPPIIITQHMPPNFTRSFAERLDQLCQITVREAADGDAVIPGQALIAPGDYHMTLRRSGARYSVVLNQDARVNHHRPAVDVMFESVAKAAGSNSIGVILTGMGGDGAEAMKIMHDQGTYTIAQDEASCVVFGMPKEAINAGGVDQILPLNQIASEVLQHASQHL